VNLHSIARPLIRAVNPEITAQFLASTGNTPTPSGKQTPTYAAPVSVSIQVQPASQQDLQHTEYMNMQGEFRTIYLRGEASGIVRLQQKGGDLFQFAEFAGDPVANWLTVNAGEKWNVNNGGWTRALVQLQTDVLS
jgi:hypothetical protein